MKNFFTRIFQSFSVMLLILLATAAWAQEADNVFTIDAKLNTRGEIRVGGFNPDTTDNERKAMFLTGQYRLNFGYKRSWLELRLSPQAAGVWGHGSANLSLAEAWANMHSKHGLFVKIGRQGLEYDDERILGYDDWAMTAPTHDVVKFGYEGYGHKVHAILAYNQNASNAETGSTYYSGGLQPYKTMQTLWYHYDSPKSLFGISLLGMNIGMQSMRLNDKKTYYQQLVGTYVTLKPKYVTMEGAFYYQMGNNEYNLPIRAFMGSAKVKVTPSDIYNFYLGYDYLSGDKYFAVPQGGQFGMILHDTIRGFSSLFGSRHDFYGAMDFFYVDSYVTNFTPGLQNAYVGGNVSPFKGFNVKAAYHFFAIATNLKNVNKALGHEAEVELSYRFADFVRLSAGYTYMSGTETMVYLQRVSEKRRLHWGWVMLTINPTIFTYAWNDKKKVNG